MITIVIVSRSSDSVLKPSVVTDKREGVIRGWLYQGGPGYIRWKAN